MLALNAIGGDVLSSMLEELLRQHRASFMNARLASPDLRAFGAAVVRKLLAADCELSPQAWAVYAYATAILVRSSVKSTYAEILAKMRQLFDSLPERCRTLKLEMAGIQVAAAIEALTASSYSQSVQDIHVLTPITPGLAGRILAGDLPCLRAASLQVNPVNNTEVVTWKPAPAQAMSSFCAEFVTESFAYSSRHELDASELLAAAGLQHLKLSGNCKLINWDTLSELCKLRTLIITTLLPKAGSPDDDTDWWPIISELPLLERAELPGLTLSWTAVNRHTQQPLARLSHLKAGSIQLPFEARGVLTWLMPALQKLAVSSSNVQLLAAVAGHDSITSLDIGGVDHTQAVQMQEQALLPSLPACRSVRLAMGYLASSRQIEEAAAAILADAAGGGALKALYLQCAGNLKPSTIRQLAAGPGPSLTQLHFSVSSMGLCALVLLLQGQLRQLRKVVLTCGGASAVANSLEQDRRELSDILRGHSSGAGSGTPAEQLAQLAQAFADSQGLAEAMGQGLLRLLHSWRDGLKRRERKREGPRIPGALPTYQPNRNITLLLNRLRARLGLPAVWDIPGQEPLEGDGEEVPVLLHLPEAQALQLVAQVEAGLRARDVALRLCANRSSDLKGRSLVVDFNGCAIHMPFSR
jgi:hypothetical protein